MRGMTTLFPGGISTWQPVIDYETPVDKILLDSIGYEFYTIEYTLGVNVNEGFPDVASRLENQESDINTNESDIASNESRIYAVEGDYVKKSGGEFEGNIGFSYYNMEYGYLYSMAGLNFTDENITVKGIKDEDDMSSDSNEHLITQQSNKAYADTKKSKRINGTFNCFVENGSFTYQKDAVGHRLNGTNDSCYSGLILPDDLTGALILRVSAQASGTDAQGMMLSMSMRGGPADSTVATRGTGVVPVASTTPVSTGGDVIKWELDLSGAGFLPGDACQMFIVGYGASGPYAATDAYIFAWEIEYE